MKLPNWDLSDLFKSISDPKIQKLYTKTLNEAKQFNDLYRGRVKSIAKSPEQILKMFSEYEKIAMASIKPEFFAEMVFAVDSSAKSGAFLQKAKKMSVDIGEQLVFFEVELSRLSDGALKKLISSKKLSNYNHYFEVIRNWRAHILEENEEKLLAKKQITGQGAFQRLFSEQLSKKKFILKGKVLGEAEILNLLYQAGSQKERKDVAEAFTKGIIEENNVLKYVTNTLLQDKQIEDEIRNFSFPEQARHLSNEISREAAEVMVGVVCDNYSLVGDYYKFKKKVLGAKKLYDYDRYASVGKNSKKYTYKEAQEIIRKAFSEFSPVFANIAEKFFAQNRIDVPSKHAKQSGAFCAYPSPDTSPYVLVNFNGSANDIMTLAHELGHAIHGELARKQTYLNYRSPLTMAETASIFAETLTFLSLIKASKNRDEIRSLYMQKIESIIASVFRQISMYRFEQQLHKTYREKGELEAKEINSIWRKSQLQMFGSSVELTENYDWWWSYIPHFINTPFYVYAYAFGELLTLSLVEISKTDKNFEKKFIEMLSSGGSKSPGELLKDFGVNLNDRKFWKGGIEIIRDYISNVKKV